MIFSIADAQNLLTIDDAVKIALKNNYGILVARNDAAISKTNNTSGRSLELGRAGFPPIG